MVLVPSVSAALREFAIAHQARGLNAIGDALSYLPATRLGDNRSYLLGAKFFVILMLLVALQLRDRKPSQALSRTTVILVVCNIEIESSVCHQSVRFEQRSDCCPPSDGNCKHGYVREYCAPMMCGVLA